MNGRWFNITVICFWLVSMSWLVVEKVLPTLLVGEPPSYRKILQEDAAAPVADQPPVGWDIYLNDRPVGWATSKIDLLPGDVHEVRSRVYLFRLPIAEVAPPWVGAFLRVMEPGNGGVETGFSMDARASLEIDPLGRPVSFRSIAGFAHAPPSRAHELSGPERFSPRETRSDFKITVNGTVVGSDLRLRAKVGDSVYRTTTFLPADALIGDAFSPQSRLPDLRVGQTWTVPVYSPFRAPTSPMEILLAKVERRETIQWSGRAVPTLVVVLSADPGAEMTSALSSKAFAWVDEHGDVLKQELTLSRSKMTFIRLPAGTAPDPGHLYADEGRATDTTP